MSILIIHPHGDANRLRELMLEVDSELSIQLWPEVDPDTVELAAVWAQPKGVLAALPRLKLICSLGAGVDHLLGDRTVPEGVAISRVLDDATVRSMVEYVLLAVLSRRRCWPELLADAEAGRWGSRAAASDPPTICVLGLGQIGAAIARSFAQLGYEVRGWSRTPQSLEGVRWCAQLVEAAAAATVVVNVLPLTDHTRGILNGALFGTLARGAQLVNVGRGAHLDEGALLAAIDEGVIAQATLDVVAEEPLSAAHPFWRRAEVIVTPHVAAQPDRSRIARQIVQNYHALREGGVIEGRIDRDRGY